MIEPSPYIRRWLEKQRFVVVGYFGKTKRINFYSLVGFWIDSGKNWVDFEENYPYVSDNFDIVVANTDELETMKKVLSKTFGGCPHVKAWSHGEELDWKEIG